MAFFADEPRVGVALAGLGVYATEHLAPALRKTRFCRLAGIVSGDHEKARRFARKYKLPSHGIYTYESFGEMVDNPEIDVVYVVTPPAFHSELTIRAARARKHVICEKPMATSIAECDAMIAACQAAGVRLAVGYRLHYHPLYQELRRLAREQPSGHFQQMTGAFGHRDRRKTWRHTRAVGGGGPLMDMGVYIIQAACMAAGDAEPIAVSAQEMPRTRPGIFDEVEEAITFALEFSNGAVCRGTASNSETFNWFRAENPEAWIRIEPAFSYTRLRARTQRGRLPRCRFNQQAALLDDFAASVRHDLPCAVPGEMGRRDVAIMQAIYRAAETGERVVI
jgi:glucose-fructose oxidoreductase